MMKDRKLEEIIEDNNWMSKTCKFVAWFLFVLCVGAGIVGSIIVKKQMEADYIYSMAILIASWIGAVLAFLLLYVIAEMIQILHDIRKKVWILSAKVNKGEK